MNEVIHAAGLKKRFGSSDVLNGIDLTIYEGEVFGFIGHNGAGKSTFINILTGIINKSGGSFTIMGAPDQNLDKVKSKIGVMPDISNLYDQMRGVQFLHYMGKLAGDKRSKQDYIALMKDVGLEGAERKKIKSYSFGMRKKICIAQALLGNPELIILDEPTSGLDPESAINIRKLITNLQQQGKTILLTSHNLDEIDKVSDRVGIISDGIIKKLGTPSELKHNNTTNEINAAIRTSPGLTSEKLAELSATWDFEVQFVSSKKPYSVVKVKDDNDLAKLSKELIHSGIQLFEIRIEQQSLEDVFINSK
ncbi:ABC-2 type transport system ATP-binding protein [Gracilibacillus ureilyticus]|uniref:ABC-2 type transport system ATP-binding protein n=1 Tax=Gracilibacillus ureilyticus TaxID=531814 RepID=A0A1H9MJX3_9BACI|nr:ABC transporter ATP-binding protein [Gracilibacillus ureilyticus]SER24010.1 ABC-2 type transport system ATP-binding protein [Gracilibacillus ureilyticus]